MGEFRLKTIIIATVILLLIVIAAIVFKSVLILFLIPVELFIVVFFRDSSRGL